MSRVVVLAANGKSFSAGADLNWMRRMADYSREQNLADAEELAELMRTLDTLSKPTIALVQGAAYGGGVGLVACCDIAIASTRAFVLSFRSQTRPFSGGHIPLCGCRYRTPRGTALFSERRTALMPVRRSCWGWFTRSFPTSASWPPQRNAWFPCSSQTAPPPWLVPKIWLRRSRPPCG